MKKIISDFMKYEASGGILLAVAAILAMVMENSPLKYLYDGFLNIPLIIQIDKLVLNKPLLLWINDGLMAIFFLLVGLEIKREFIEGKLSSFKQVSLPAIAAIGGIIGPSLIYSYINWENQESLRGWAIPAATDIAFALGVLSLLGKRIPNSLRISLVAIAVLDDIAAICIIALFYTSNLSLFSLGVGIIAVIVLGTLNLRGVRDLTPYMIVGVILWVCVLKSGVHATLAGVLLAFFIPLKGDDSPARYLEKSLHPWVSFAILPIFAFVNAGVSLKGLSFELLTQPITLGIALGLFFGKQIGVMLFTFLGIILGICKLPTKVSVMQFYGMSLITGVGFTMSLFIGTLAFADIEHQTAVRLGVLTGSALSGICGYLVLIACSKK